MIRCRGHKPPTMMPTDCSVLRTLTILPNIRISRDIHPTFMLISGRVPRSFTHLGASSCGLRPFAPGIIKYPPNLLNLKKHSPPSRDCASLLRYLRPCHFFQSGNIRNLYHSSRQLHHSLTLEVAKHPCDHLSCCPQVVADHFMGNF